MEMEMRSQQFGHNHPMVFNQVLSNQTKEASCLRCGETVSASSFCCAECGLYLHKRCAEAASQIDHPFHHKHPLVLLPQPPYKGRCICNFCNKTCEKFVYHCSCNFDLHIKCALLSLGIAEKKIGVLEHLAIKVPLLSTKDDSKELEGAKCFVCWEPLLGSVHFPLDCGFNLHKKCVELPHGIKCSFHKQHPLILQFDFKPSSCKICQHMSPARGFVYSCPPCKITLHIKCARLSPTLNLPCHRKHPLTLKSNFAKDLSCKACKGTQHNQFMYGCSSCMFFLHIECALPPQTIKGKGHAHPFTLFWRPSSFTCDACGSEGHFRSYICSPCHLLVHQTCIPLPPLIEIPRHEHPISHKYSLPQYRFKICDCGLCGIQVNIEYGSYSCFTCLFIVHVKCALEEIGWFHVIEGEGGYGILPLSRSSNLINLVTQKNKGGETAEHSSHVHDLELWHNPMEECGDGGNLMENYCDGCVLPISSPFYYCVGCNFLLHQTCAELPQKKKLWFHKCQKLLILVECPVFKCDFCRNESNGFSYRCDPCDVHYCLPCAASGYKIKHQAHEHPLLYHRKHGGRCSACNVRRVGLFKCMSCTFSFKLHIKCSRLPRTAWHMCDEHLLALTYKEVNNYSEYHYCDICEEKRDPRKWFYHCATCDVSAHPGCALGGYPFIKPGSIYKALEDHPHSLTFVKKIFSGPGCHKCGKPCRDLALECSDPACNYIVDWGCAKPASLRRGVPAGFKSETDQILPSTNGDEDTSCIVL